MSNRCRLTSERALACLACAVWVLAAVPPVVADTFYVRTCADTSPLQCSNVNDGKSPETAWATIQWAAEQINRFGNPGDVVIVGPGVYHEGDIDLQRSGIPAHVAAAAVPIVFRGDASGASTNDAPAPVLVEAGSLYDTGFLIFGASDVVVSGFHVTGARVAGIQVRPNSAGQPSNRAVIANNVIFANGGSRLGRGVQVVDSSNVLVFNNVIYDNTTVGISLGGVNPGAPNARVINNTVYGHHVDDSVAFGIVIGAQGDASGGTTSASPGAWVINNIVADNDVGIDVNRTSACDYIAAFNLVRTPREDSRYGDTTRRDRSDIHGDPRFVAPGGGNFALSAADGGQVWQSPAIDAGSEDASVFGLDDASTRTDGRPDAGGVDLGFHAGNVDYPLFETVPIVPHKLYVRKDGRDSNDGSSPDRPLETIQRAVEIARAQTTIIVGPGGYREGGIGPKDRTPAGPIEFLADPSGALTGDAAGRVLLDAAGARDGFEIVGYCSTIIDGFAITNALDSGVALNQAHHSIVRNNVSFSNRSLGIQVVNADDVQVMNNLVYANGGRKVGGGIQVGGDAGSHRAVIESNTVYANGVNGLLIGTGGVPSTDARVRYNIVSGNGENGIQLDASIDGGVSAIGYCAEYNINTDGYGRIQPPNCAACMATTNVAAPCTVPACRPEGFDGCTIRPVSDLSRDPAFVSPRGADNCLGGSRFWDDDFHLQQLAAGQSIDSPAVNFSRETAEMLGLDDRSTRTDGVADSGPADLGHHYLPVALADEVAPVGDCDDDGRVTVNELVSGVNIVLGNLTLDACPSFDVNRDGRVTIDELVQGVNDILCVSA